MVLARRLGRPLKYTETRSESMMAAHHGRDQWQKLTLSAEKDGTVTGFKVELLADLGSHIALLGGGIPILGAFIFGSSGKSVGCRARPWMTSPARPKAWMGIPR